MADFVSALTGVQMDQALLDMAEHNSEAYAVGERNGIAVAPDDVTYHNNARYYAQIASSQIVGDASSAVRWDTDQSEALTSAQKAVARNNIGAASDSDVVKITSQTLTSAEQEQARENINATPYNYNLLDNSWFLVNSRGQSSYSTAGLTVDRWKNMNSSATTTVTSNGLTLTSDTTGGLRQNVGTELNAFLTGKNVTFSILFQDGTISEWQFVWSDSHSNRGINGSVTLYAGGASGISINRNATISVRAFKLEIGSFSTLKYDSIPNYGDELTRCIYSTVDTTDPYANNGFGRTNPNLLDNPWFTVNQRGQSSYTGRVYGVDRWIEYGSSNTVTVTSDGITLPVDTNSGFEQYFDDTFIQGKTVTISFMTADGTVTSKTVTWPTSGAKITAYTNGVAFFFGTVVGKKGLAILTNAEVTIRAVKLELGSVSTLANDAPPDYAEELAKCQRYFLRLKSSSQALPLGFGVQSSSTAVRLLIPTPVEMRAQPTVSFSGTHRISGGDATSKTVTSYSVVDRTSSGIGLVANISSGTFAENKTYILYVASGGYLDLSAEL